jgi:hypothetical protein
MNLGDLVQRVNIKLGEQSTFYPTEEIVANGLNPAQRLLCLAYPTLLQKRAVLSINPDQVFTDLRQITPTIRKINRVVLGDVTVPAGSFVATTGELTRLLPTTLERLAGFNDWMRKTGQTRKYWLHGAYWLGLWKRPMTTLTVSIMYDAIPEPLTLSSLAAEPDITQIYHPLIADIAAGLLVQKEGNPTGQRGLESIVMALKDVGL